jgi:hypothetical protein
MKRQFLGWLVIAAATAVTPRAEAQDDLFGSLAKLGGDSAELQKVQDQLKDRREEIKKEVVAVQQEEKKVDEMKAAASSSDDPGPIAGPYRLFTGAYSNTVDRKGASESEAFGGPAPGGEDFNSLAEAHAKAEAHMGGSNQPSFRIEDKTGKIIESGGPFGRGKRLSASRLANPTGPKADGSALDRATAALSARQSASGEAMKRYLADKAKYDKDLAAYNASVEKLKQSMPDALQEFGMPTPTAADMAVSKGDYSVDDLGALATTYMGKPVKDGTAVSFVQDVAKLPEPSKWGKGAKVEGTPIRPGTPIATIKADGAFSAVRGNHAAVYITQNKKGIWVYDQYMTAAGVQKPVDARFLKFKNGVGSPSNDASAYSVIKKTTVVVPDLPPEK